MTDPKPRVLFADLKRMVMAAAMREPAPESPHDAERAKELLRRADSILVVGPRPLLRGIPETGVEGEGTLTLECVCGATAEVAYRDVPTGRRHQIPVGWWIGPDDPDCLPILCPACGALPE